MILSTYTKLGETIICRHRCINGSISQLKLTGNYFLFRKHSCKTGIRRYCSNQEIDEEEQRRKANLGNTVSKLKKLVPELLNDSLPSDILADDIGIRVYPSHFPEWTPFLPDVRGQVAYYLASKTLQLIAAAIILNSRVKLHIESVRVSREIEYHCEIPDAMKVYIRWTTCLEGCPHLNEACRDEVIKSPETLSESQWSKIDPFKALKWNKGPNPKMGFPLFRASASQLTSGIIRLRSDDNQHQIERVMSGVFVFELNETHDEIRVHTIDDVETIEKKQSEPVSGLRVC